MVGLPGPFTFSEPPLPLLQSGTTPATAEGTVRAGTGVSTWHHLAESKHSVNVGSQYFVYGESRAQRDERTFLRWLS